MPLARVADSTAVERSVRVGVHEPVVQTHTTPIARALVPCCPEACERLSDARVLFESHPLSHNFSSRSLEATYAFVGDEAVRGIIRANTDFKFAELLYYQWLQAPIRSDNEFESRMGLTPGALCLTFSRRNWMVSLKNLQQFEPDRRMAKTTVTRLRISPMLTALVMSEDVQRRRQNTTGWASHGGPTPRATPASDRCASRAGPADRRRALPS
jgi:hypothetical protein